MSAPRAALWVVAVLSVSVIGLWTLQPSPGHSALHIGCTHHNHGPARTAGEGQRLLDARALIRQRREATE